jgi:tetratricopeptide (TPR) repeat protein/class 3 adenylate cyclase
VTDIQEPNPSPCLEMAHVLFMDIVAYSQLPMDEQTRLVGKLQQIVRSTTEFVRAQKRRQLLRLPTGDGMALVFFGNAEAPVRCAIEISRALRDNSELKLRMGVHTGPVQRVEDINANRNVAGGGINIAQRVMDCGDAGHILVSSTHAEVLGHVSSWSAMLHDLGEAEVKHGVRVHIYNLYNEDAGNPELPKKISVQRAAPSEAATKIRKKNLLSIVIGGVAALALALVGGWLFYAHKAHALGATDTIVLADFTNKTGDAVFDDTLRQGLSVGLAQSPFFNLLSDQKIRDTLKLMGRAPEERVTPQIARDLCQRTHSKAYLSGSIAGLGSQYVIGLKAVNCSTGNVLAEAQEQAAGKEAVLKALDSAAVNLRSKLGESLSSVEKYATPLAEATTPSLEALKAYSLGYKATSAKGDTAALPFYRRAIELDPNFAAAYANLSVAYSNLNEVGRAAENARKAYELREKVSEPERLSIEANYHLIATGELEKAAQAYELWQQAYPRDDSPNSNLGFIYGTIGNWEKFLQETREAVRMEPNNVVGYGNLGLAYMYRNQLDEAEAVCKQAEQRKLEGELLLGNRYVLAFLKGDASQMAQLVSAAMGMPGTEDVLLASQADTEAWYGKMKNAHELTRRAMDSAQHNDAKETAATYQAAAALRDVESGNRRQALADAGAAVRLAPNRDVRAMAALALARGGDMAGAEKLAAELDKTFPLDTLVQRYWLPTIQAAVALQRKDPNRAVELLNVASPIELGQPTTITVSLCPVYLRGEAYLMLSHGKAAAAEFQKFINHYGLVQNFPWGALARLGLARAYAMQGDTAKARTKYQDFLTLWKDADPDIPILKQAKAEYAKLH